ncbi:MAG: hypothetical protein AB1782_09835 [Cyanobacteriota bacterium]
MNIPTNNNVAFGGIFTCLSTKPAVVKKFVELAKGPGNRFAARYDTRVHKVMGQTNIGTRTTLHDNIFLDLLKKAGFIENRHFTYVPGMTLPVNQTSKALEVKMLPETLNKVV